MKKISLLIISLIILSCTDNTVTPLEDLKVHKSKKYKVLSNKGTETEKSLSTKDLKVELDIYSYVIGRVLIKDPIAASEIIKLVSSNNTIYLNGLIEHNQIIKNAIQLEIINLDCFWGWTPPQSDLGSTQPALENKQDPIRYSKISSKILTEVKAGALSSCLEIYIARPLAFLITNKKLIQPERSYTISTSPHPLSENNWTNGYSLYTDNTGLDNGTNEIFDAAFLLNHYKNVIVVRPVRNSSCTYSNIDVIDFTTFYK